MQTTSTTRGLAFEPSLAARQREAERAIVRARRESEIRQCYSEHMTGQRRYMGAKRAGVVS